MNTLKDEVVSYQAAKLKRDQLEREIRQYTEGNEQANMLHTLSKLWMFLVDEFVPDEVVDATDHQRRMEKFGFRLRDRNSGQTPRAVDVANG